MIEGVIVIFLVIFFSLAGLVLFFSEELYGEFNFHKSEITINGKFVTEKLYFKTDKQYHTLYRNFKDHIIDFDTNFYKNYMKIINVSCLSGKPYIKDISGNCNFFINNTKTGDNCLPYTEKNEYGCSFGNVYGFSEGNIYWIQATYKIHPENIFQN